LLCREQLLDAIAGKAQCKFRGEQGGGKCEKGCKPTTTPTLRGRQARVKQLSFDASRQASYGV